VDRPSRLVQLMEGVEVFGALAADMAKVRTHVAVMPHDVLKARAWGADSVTSKGVHAVYRST
jgi:hypothetical protein